MINELKHKTAFITAIFGKYDLNCKPFVEQTVEADFICFTEDSKIVSNGWEIDPTPYHIINPSPLDHGNYHNSLKRNRHTFNIAKYYKQAWHNIPRLAEYDTVIWIDGSIEIIDPRCAEQFTSYVSSYGICAWNHERREGKLIHEVEASDFPRYTSTRWKYQDQPYQDVYAQYEEYIKDGYSDDYWENYERSEGRGFGPNFGVWMTGIVAFNNNSPQVIDFLSDWYLQTLKYTTQDQIGFPKTVQNTGLVPYTLPDDKVRGRFPQKETSMHIVHLHGPGGIKKYYRHRAGVKG